MSTDARGCEVKGEKGWDRMAGSEGCSPPFSGHLQPLLPRAIYLFALHHHHHHHHAPSLIGLLLSPNVSVQRLSHFVSLPLVHMSVTFPPSLPLTTVGVSYHSNSLFL